MRYNHVMKRTSLSVLLVLLAGGLPAADTPWFPAGHRIGFLGDSITHGGRYHAEMLLFCATRFPGTPVEVINAGVAGDTAKGALRRLDAAIAEETKKKSWRVGYFTNLAKAYVALKPKEGAIRRELAERTAALFKACRPVPRRYRLRRVP